VEDLCLSAIAETLLGGGPATAVHTPTTLPLLLPPILSCYRGYCYPLPACFLTVSGLEDGRVLFYCSIPAALPTLQHLLPAIHCHCLSLPAAVRLPASATCLPAVTTWEGGLPAPADSGPLGKTCLLPAGRTPGLPAPILRLCHYLLGCQDCCLRDTTASPHWEAATPATPNKTHHCLPGNLYLKYTCTIH